MKNLPVDLVLSTTVKQGSLTRLNLSAGWYGEL